MGLGGRFIKGISGGSLLTGCAGWITMGILSGKIFTFVSFRMEK